MLAWLTTSTIYIVSFVFLYLKAKKHSREAYQRGRDVGYTLGYQEGQLKLLKALSGRKVSDIEFLKSLGITS